MRTKEEIYEELIDEAEWGEDFHTITVEITKEECKAHFSHFEQHPFLHSDYFSFHSLRDMEDGTVLIMFKRMEFYSRKYVPIPIPQPAEFIEFEMSVDKTKRA